MLQAQEPTETTELAGMDRRRLLTGVGTVGALTALTSVWTSGSAYAAPENNAASLTIDVACIGTTFYPDLSGAADAGGGDFRGGTFIVEGYIYPAGTIPAGPLAFDPSQHPAQGDWLCRGWFLLNPARPEPHVLTTQEYYLGSLVSPSNPSPADSLVSSGTEGGVPMTTRAVIGGTGRHRKARGQVVQRTIGTNTTILNGLGENAPNFRFSFSFA